jgi:DNA repair exonuclease SbcCD ATPase subunit
MSELRRDREWEHWPERRQDGGIRRHLRDLFHPTLSEDEVEQAIAVHAHELELRAAQLADTVADLERREERTRELRSAVEQMLRRGSAELDERHAELSELAGRLSGRESVVAETEVTLAERRRELGAVELRRAAVERREETLTDRERELGRREDEIAAREQALEDLDERARAVAEREAALTRRATEIEALRSRVEDTLSVVEREQQLLSEREAALLDRERALGEREDAVAGLEERERELHTSAAELRLAVDSVSRGLGVPEAAPPAPSASAAPADTAPPGPSTGPDYVALVIEEGRYRLVTRDDGPPLVGAEVVVDGTTYRIVRLGASPLPGDRRRCAFTEQDGAPLL